MKRNELAEIRKLDNKSVWEKIKKAQKEVSDLVIERNMKKLPNLKAVKNKRRGLAQMLTILGQKQSIEELEKSSAKEEK